MRGRSPLTLYLIGCKGTLRFQSVLQRRERMAHAARAHVTWMSAVIIATFTASYLTWLITTRRTKPTGVVVGNGIIIQSMLKDLSSSQTAHCLYKVSNTSAADSRLSLVEEGCEHNFSLDKDKTWITVKESGVYLVYIQLTYGLKKDGKSRSVDLGFYVEFKYPEGQEEFVGSFDTRPLGDNEQDAHLSSFFLLQMSAKNSLAIKTGQKKRIKYNDVHPFSSYITIIRYADWSG